MQFDQHAEFLNFKLGVT